MINISCSDQILILPPTTSQMYSTIHPWTLIPPTSGIIFLFPLLPPASPMVARHLNLPALAVMVIVRHSNLKILGPKVYIFMTIMPRRKLKRKSHPGRFFLFIIYTSNNVLYMKATCHFYVYNVGIGH